VADALVKARPECLPSLCAAMARADAAEGPRRARQLVREALLAGRELEPNDFRHDPPVADLLAEDLAPRWLASLGAISRIWPAPPLDEAALSGFGGDDGGASSDDEEAFWRCLRVADDPRAPVESRHEARRRMKRLRPDLHARYMGRAPAMTVDPSGTITAS
jgi:hypothetical protein